MNLGFLKKECDRVEYALWNISRIRKVWSRFDCIFIPNEMKWLIAVEKFDFWAEWSKERLWVVYCIILLLRTNSKRIIRILIVSYVDGLIVVFTVSWDEFIGIVILWEWNYLISDFEYRWWRWIWFPMNWREWLILNILGIKINRVFEFSENVFVSIVGYPLISFEILSLFSKIVWDFWSWIRMICNHCLSFEMRCYPWRSFDMFGSFFGSVLRSLLIF